MTHSNFTFLTPHWNDIAKTAMLAEKHTYTDPVISAAMTRKAMEAAVHWIFNNDYTLNRPYQTTLTALLHEQTFKDLVHNNTWQGLNLIRKLGNRAAHEMKPVKDTEALASLRYLYGFLRWLASSYGTEKLEPAPFDTSLLPEGEAHKQDKATIEKLKKELQEASAKLEAETRNVTLTKEELTQQKEAITRLKHENAERSAEEARSNTPSEAETRKLIIDLLLEEAGWNLGEPNTIEYEVRGMPNTQGIGYADYVLWGDDGLPLAVVEAKKASVDSSAGKHQAKLYADCLEAMHGQRPVIFYTNGYNTWIWDDQFYPPRETQGFYTRDELQLTIHRRTTREDIRTIAINAVIAGRYYQESAIRHVMETYHNKARGALVVMATGSGKTRTAIAMVELLMKANWVKRALFLADRTALVRQARKNFVAHMPQISVCNLVEDKEDVNTRIVFSTYPTMMNAIDETRGDGTRLYTPGHFDLIIIDEAHRSVYQKYQAIFTYFDALLLGLTATPKAEVDHNTYNLFGLEDHMPTFAYELTTAVEDGYLVPYHGVSVSTKFQREGIKYNELSEEEKEEYEKEFRDEESGFFPDEIGSSALNQWLFNEDTVDKVLGYLMEHGKKIEGGDRLGKTIIFAKNHKHAEFIDKRFNAIFPQYKGDFLRVIDNQVKYAHKLIEDFEDGDKEPTVAVSVDMLDTGIDIPAIVNLVFFKVVRSKAKFWQMIGRGTRLCEDLYGPGEHKDGFLIFDFCSNFDFFDEHPNGIELKSSLSLSARIFKQRLELSYELQSGRYQEDEEYRNLYLSLLDIMHSNTESINKDSFLARPHKRYIDEYIVRKRWDNITKTDILDITDHLIELAPNTQEDELAKRFDSLILSLQLTMVQSLPVPTATIDNLVSMASDLENKANVPAVRQALELIRYIQTDEFLQNLDILILENVRVNLRDLIKHIDKENRSIVYTDFTDEISGTVKDYTSDYGDSNLKNYHKRFEKYIRDHQDHIVIHKLKFNKPITESDISELEKILFSEDELGTREDYLKNYGDDKPLTWFIRTIVGLDRNAAMEAFSDFMKTGALTPVQISFINHIIDYLTDKGVMDPAKLFEPPFTNQHSSGVVGIFPEKEVESIVSIIKTINSNAS